MARTAKRRIRRVLIANRAEIAVRIARACKELGIETVQVYSEADGDSMPVMLADRAVCLGPASSALSYLDPERIVGAALAFEADAIHPGYGFLSERADFSGLCTDEGLVFVGPAAKTIEMMGDKATARKIASDAGVPVIPGSTGVVRSKADLHEVAKRIGAPVMLKAAAGGGGRGMRIVEKIEDLDAAYADASREAKNAFGDDSIYVERYMPSIRHIEVQVLGDGKDVIHLGERDCSVQRRNQKLIEESPAAGLTGRQRNDITEAAIKLCTSIGYTSAGTIEFILDQATGGFFFIEMNTRVQVEHPVTEMTTGIDIVKAQLKIASGEKLPWSQDQVEARGHAIECRINAENPDQGFLPSPGRIDSLTFPGGPGVRVDSHLYDGYIVPPNYDSLLAKIIAWGSDRQEALARMDRALSESRIDGVATTTGLHRRILNSKEFSKGGVNTRFLKDAFGI